VAATVPDDGAVPDLVAIREDLARLEVAAASVGALDRSALAELSRSWQRRRMLSVSSPRRSRHWRTRGEANSLT
jgi:hypothetical protein